MSKVGLVLEGGALRGIFTAGVLDFLLEQNIYFQYIVGVSAGSGNAVNFVARQIGRSKKVITHEDTKPYYGMRQLKESRKLLNLDVLVDDYALNVFPLDFDAYFASGTFCECVVTNCVTGEAEYLSSDGDRDRLLLSCKASCAVPFACEPVLIDNVPYLDGSIADGIPIEHAMKQGCDKLVVVLTKPEGSSATDYSKIKRVIGLKYQRKYPNLCSTMISRKVSYDKQMEALLALEREGKALILRPQDNTVGHFENDSSKLNDCYEMGYKYMEEQFEGLQAFMM